MKNFESGSDYFRTLGELLQDTEATDRKGRLLGLEEGLQKASDLILRCEKSSGAVPATRKVLLVGNGGSAAIVSHVQNDLCKMVGVQAMVFTEQPLLTAIANDHGYDKAYAKLTHVWARKGDVLWAVSSSGRSKNILDACEAARGRGAEVITFSGFQADNPLRKLGDVNFYVASDRYGFVEVAHQALGHYLTDRACSHRPEAKDYWTEP
jgi:D-sedoheptulose 7-phosphate isomerase